ncbi:response regulator transcription factor [Actinoplanes sp. TRM 88003]|uniref:Response regulator transcription factor n=1 Tax=Paractinoplanes aksuensis TaxID=2939490 RepID=A0ABT1DTZ4_9ACTN|nr:response regulator transcription factor [Actinoplanes aksuensis]MCO8274297.1 response regulator transcription factor [Actinoplanes aksuensis]
MPEQITVLVVDDHPLFRKGLRALLATMPSVDVVGEAVDGKSAVELARSLRPQLVLMDLHMPGGDGPTAIRALAAAPDGPHILVVTMFEDDDSVFAALRAGARGYVLKDTDDDEMTRAILAVGHGEAIFSAAIASRIVAFFAGRPPAEPFPGLTASERNVLQLMSRGLPNDVIAAQLQLSAKTVRNYVSNVFAKLHVASRAEAIARARDAGI